MRRRGVLRSGAGLLALSMPVVAAREVTRSTETAFAPLGRRSIPGAADCRVSADGETAFVATGEGFVAVSIGDLEPIASVDAIEADREGGPLSGIADLAVDGERLLVPGPANHRSGRLSGVALFDVSDPASPVQVAFYETSFPIHNAALSDDVAYLTAGRSLVVVDLSEDEPTAVGRWSLADVDPAWSAVHPALWVLHDVRVRGDLAVCSLWDAGTWLVDVSEPSAMTAIGRAGGRSPRTLRSVDDDRVGTEATQLPGNHHSAALSADGSLLAVGAEAFDAREDDGDGGPGGIQLYDLGDATAPRRLARIDPPPADDETRSGTWTTAHDFAFDGQRLLSAWYQGGVKIHDVADPRRPRETAWWRRPDEVAFWTALPAAGKRFVAAATTLPGGDLFSGLYTFPVRAGEQPDPPVSTGPPTATTAARSPRPPTASRTTRSPGQRGFEWAAPFGAVVAFVAWRRWRRR